MKKTKKKQEQQQEAQKSWCSLEVRRDESGVRVQIKGDNFDILDGMLVLTSGAARGVASMAVVAGEADSGALTEIMAEAFADAFEKEFVRTQKKLGR